MAVRSLWPFIIFYKGNILDGIGKKRVIGRKIDEGGKKKSFSKAIETSKMLITSFHGKTGFFCFSFRFVFFKRITISTLSLAKIWIAVDRHLRSK